MKNLINITGLHKHRTFTQLHRCVCDPAKFQEDVQLHHCVDADGGAPSSQWLMANSKSVSHAQSAQDIWADFQPPDERRDRRELWSSRRGKQLWLQCPARSILCTKKKKGTSISSYTYPNKLTRGLREAQRMRTIHQVQQGSGCS